MSHGISLTRFNAFAAAAAMALAVSASAASAQLVIGAKVGATFSKIDVEGDDTEQSRFNSLGGGGFIRFGLGGLSLQPEILALTKGSKVEDPGTDDDGKVKLDYIEIPVLLRFGLGQGPYVMAGPSIGFDIGCTVEAEAFGAEFSSDCDEVGADIFDRNKTDFGLTGVLGFEAGLGPGRIFVEGRYTHGLTDLAKEDDAKAKNRTFGVFAGFSIGLGN
jgi:hypothetical protein